MVDDVSMPDLRTSTTTSTPSSPMDGTFKETFTGMGGHRALFVLVRMSSED